MIMGVARDEGLELEDLVEKPAFASIWAFSGGDARGRRA